MTVNDDIGVTTNDDNNNNDNNHNGNGPSGMQGLVKMIAGQNPYTSGDKDDMDFYLSNPNVSEPDGGISQIELELDGSYPGNWDFKGQPQKISRALKIKYRCKVRKKDANGNQDPTGPVLYWMTAYLLVGFEDGGP